MADDNDKKKVPRRVEQLGLGLGNDDLPLFHRQAPGTARASVAVLGVLEVDRAAAMALSPDGARLAVGQFQWSAVDRLRIHEVDRLTDAGLTLERETSGFTYGASRLVWHPRAQFVLAGTHRQDGAVCVWRTDAKRDGDDTAMELYRHGDNVTGLAFAKTGAQVFSTSGCYDKSIRSFVARPTVMGGMMDWDQGAFGHHWDAELELNDLYGFEDPSVSPDGELLAVRRTMKSGETHLDVRRPRHVYELVRSIPSRSGVSSWTHDGGAVVGDDAEGFIVRWGLDGRVERLSPGGEGPVVSVAVAPDDRFVVCARHVGQGDLDKTPHLLQWLSLESPTGRVLAEAELPATPRSLCLIEGGSTALVALANGAIMRVHTTM